MQERPIRACHCHSQFINAAVATGYSSTAMKRESPSWVWALIMTKMEISRIENSRFHSFQCARKPRVKLAAKKPTVATMVIQWKIVPRKLPKKLLRGPGQRSEAR